jgi:hypothetical protein
MRPDKLELRTENIIVNCADVKGTHYHKLLCERAPGHLAQYRSTNDVKTVSNRHNLQL